MKITVTVSKAAFPGHVPFKGCAYVDVTGADCPVCATKSELRAGDGRILALFGPDGRDAARTAFPRADEFPPPALGSLKVRLPTFEIGHDRYTGQAECCRCRSAIGPMVVEVSTLFGLDEDDRVLNGRCRVY